MSLFWTEEHEGRCEVVVDTVPLPPPPGHIKIRGEGSIFEGCTWKIGRFEATQTPHLDASLVLKSEPVISSDGGETINRPLPWQQNFSLNIWNLSFKVRMGFSVGLCLI